MNDRRDTIDGLMIFMKKHLPCSETGCYPRTSVDVRRHNIVFYLIV